MITKEQLQEVFHYDHTSGQLIRKKARGGAVCGPVEGFADRKGYRRMRFGPKFYFVHRIVFLLVHGYLPAELDHINGDRSDNRVGNLRPATSQQNKQNKAVSSANRSGLKGVSWDTKANRWRASASHMVEGKKRKVYLGLYHDMQDAHAAYVAFAKPAHGDFYNPN